MKRILTIVAAAFVAMTTQAQTRQTICLNDGWKFQLGDVGNAEKADFNDNGWRTLTLPHDFQIEQPWVPPTADERPDNTDVAANIKSRLSSRGFKEMGRGWYRLHFTPADSLKGRRVLIDFAGIMYVGDVYLHGELVGGTDYGYVGFEIDVTDKLRFGQENVLAVMADTREPGNSRWYTGGGLFRGVKMVTTPKDLYFNRHPLCISTRDNRYVSIGAEYTNRTKAKEVDFRIRVYDPDGQIVYDGKSTQKRNPQARTVERQLADFEVKDPQLWDTERPLLYKAVVTMLREDGTVADEASSSFGIRTVEFGPDFGMKLNGKKVLLKGYANHHTLGALGAAAYPRAIEKRILLMKQYGINHIRTSHNPYSREFIELCDKYGILVVDELYDKWTRQHTGGRVAFEELWQHDVPEWIKRDRNSPSVVLWSLGNELQQDPNQPFNDFGVTMFQLQKILVQRYDSTRLVTVAMHPRYRNWDTDSLPCSLAMITDVQAYNYRYMYFPGDYRRFPWMKFYQSEATTAAMGPNYYEMDLNKVIGLAYWGAIDYLGESQGWPAKGWAQGVFYIDLSTKPNAYLAKSIFSDEPVVHICVQEQSQDIEWNGVKQKIRRLTDHWTRTEGEQLSITTYTNADEVELVVNGKSLGKKQNELSNPKVRNQIRWDKVDYHKGYIEAIARSGGKIVARHRVETAGPAKKLTLEPDLDLSKDKGLRSKVECQQSTVNSPLRGAGGPSWLADGRDLQHIVVTATDSKGRVVPSANTDITFSVDGPAEIIAVSSGDHYSDELTFTNHRRLYDGRCLVILRSGRTPGKVTLTATGEGFKPTRLVMTTYQK